jgi:hypothetical protein
MTATTGFETIAEALTTKKDVSRGNLFGKACIKLDTKAFAAFHKDEMVFKLNNTDQAKAMALKGAHLWDPSGTNRPMKEWTCVPFVHLKDWQILADKALAQARKVAK